MTRISIRSAALAAVTAIALLPAIAAAQTPDRPRDRPAAEERRAEPRAAPHQKAGRDHRVSHRDVADRRGERSHRQRHDRDRNDGRPADRRERRG
jgi:hypothetical protein